MLIFLNTPALATSLGLRGFDETVRDSRPGRRTATRGRRRAGHPSRRHREGRRGSWLARSLRLAH